MTTHSTTDNSGNVLTVRLEHGGIVHAGEYLRVVLHISSSSSVKILLLLGSLHVSGELIIPNDKVFTVESLSQLRKCPHSKRDSLKGRFTIFTMSPEILFTLETIEASTDYSYECIVKLPVDLIPSYKGKAMITKYLLTVALQISHTENIENINIEDELTILPAFSNDDADGVTLPFMRYDLYKLPILQEKSYTSKINLPLDSVWQRYKRGIIPTIKDFKEYPKNPLTDILHHISSKSSEESQSNLFNYFVRESAPKYVSLKSGEEVVAELKLNRGIFRFGEQLECIVKFPPSTTSISVFQLAIQVLCTETINSSQTLDVKDHDVRVYKKYEAVAWMHDRLSFAISLPSTDANATLYTNLMECHWSLHFTFITASTNGTTTTSFMGRDPTEGSKDIITCTIPIKIVPSLPLLLHTRQQAPTSAKSISIKL